MRNLLFLLAGLSVWVLSSSQAFAQGGGRQGGGGGFGGGRGGWGGGGGMPFDPNQMFDRMANGKEVLVRSELDPRRQPMFDRWAQTAGVTNGQLTREQFVKAFQQGIAQWGRGGGGGGRGRQQDGQPGAPANSGGSAGGRQGTGNNSDDRAERMFRRYDQNGDGLLNNDEMPEDLRTERDKWDANKDGFIDLTEFKAYFQARMQQDQADRGGWSNPGWQLAPGVELVPEPAEVEEPKPIAYRVGKLPKELPSWFAQLDTDQDAQIGLYEWKKSGRSMDEFKKIDRNGDGFLTVEEVLRYVRETGNKSTANEAAPAIAERSSFMSGPGFAERSTNSANGSGGRRARPR